MENRERPGTGRGGALAIVLKPEELLDQADDLAAGLLPGQIRQIDLRRAISSAYYAVFHLCLTELADMVVKSIPGTAENQAARYGLVYRKIAHRDLRQVCSEIQLAKPSRAFQNSMPALGFSPDIRFFGRNFVDLQASRHTADYNPMSQFTALDAQAAAGSARAAFKRFGRVDPPEKALFLTLVLCPPRS